MIRFSKIRISNRSKKTGISLLLLSLLMVSYQNCSGGLGTTLASGSAETTPTDSTSSNGGTTDGSGTGTGSTNDTAAAQAEKLRQCKALLTTPSISLTAPANAELTVYSGAGGSSGHAASAKATMSFNRGITNTTQANTLGCVYATDMKCEIVKDDGAHPLVLNKIIDGAGDDITSLQTDDTKKAAVLGDALSRTDCNTTLTGDYQITTKDFQVKNGGGNNAKFCADGTAYLKVSIQTKIDNDNMSPVSNVFYVKVNVHDACWNESRLKTGTAYPTNINFGSAVAIDGNWAAVAAPKESSEKGAVYMFKKDSMGWVFSQKITDGTNNLQTLNSLSLKGSRLAIGSNYRPNGSSVKTGAVLYYELDGTNTWNKIAEIFPLASNCTGQTFTCAPVENQRFGASVALNDTDLVVGSPGMSIVEAGTTSSLSGLVYVYNCAAGACSFKYTIGPHKFNTTYGSRVAFGTSVALDGTKLVVGAPQAILYESFSDGYVNTYTLVSGTTPPVADKHIEPSDSDSGFLGMRFGDSVSVLGGKLAVGAPLKIENITAQTIKYVGGVYYYKSETALVSGKPAATNMKVGTVDGSNFGNSVAMSSTGLMIGCPYCNSRAGVGFWFKYAADQTLPTAANFNLFALNDAANDGFGFSMGISGTSVIVGAPIKNDPNVSAGAGYIYTMNP